MALLLARHLIRAIVGSYAGGVVKPRFGDRCLRSFTSHSKNLELWVTVMARVNLALLNMDVMLQHRSKLDGEGEKDVLGRGLH